MSTSHDGLPDIVRISVNVQYSTAEARAELAAAGEEITKNSIIEKISGWALANKDKDRIFVLFTDPSTGDEVHFFEDSEF